MRSFFLVGSALFFGILSSLGQERDVAATHETVQLNGHVFTLPRGFTIELAVKPGLIDRPITVDFDEQGRLYVADSSGSNDPVKQQLKERTHRIVRLEDRDGDGIFDHSTVFADRMMFPEGTLWHDGSLYVAAPPSIWKLTDTNGDGIADQRLEWFKGKTLTNCANDLHGPYLGLDGRIYWTKGAFAEQRYQRPGKPDFVTSAAHVFRARVDGTEIEPVMTGGMDNPVDVTFTPSGDRIFTTTFFQHPAGGRRDGLVHAIYGGIYGKDHAPIYAHPWTGPTLMPVLTHLGPAAPAGLTRYESAAFGKEYVNNLFVAQFNLRKVSRHVLQPSGASYVTLDSDFVVSDNHDFHPTDVMEDADGSLLVIDTGGWYKLCCPSSQLAKADVHGAIYRVRKKGAARLDDPRGLKLDWKNVPVARLGDARPAVVRRTMHQLSQQGVAILTDLDSAPRLPAIWTATRIDAPGARAFVRKALSDENDENRIAALHSISLWRDKQALPTVTKLLQHPSPAVRRVAAEAIGRIGDGSAISALFEAMRTPADRALEHSLIYALIEIGDREATAKGLETKDPRVKRAALVALDQMPNGGLPASKVVTALNSGDASLRDAAWWISGRHPHWADSLASFFRARLREMTATDELASRLARFARTPVIQQLLRDRLREGSSGEKRIVLRAMAGASLKPTPSEWVEALTSALEGDQEVIRAALQTARSLPIDPGKYPRLNARLLQLAGDEKNSAELRLGALAAIPGGVRDLPDALFHLVLESVASDQPLVVRALAVEILTRGHLSREQLVELARKLPTTGPMELDRLIDAFARSADAEVGKELLRALPSAPGRASLRVDGLKTRLTKYDAKFTKALDAFCAELNVDLLKQRAELDRLAMALKSGDVRRGQAVFNSPKAACISCHAIGYVGGKIGPDLTRIGSIRTERDLLESILYPSASFVRSYEPVQIATLTGQSFNGVVKQETPEEVILTLSAIEEKRVARKQIEQMEPSKVSIMPAGLEKILTQQELADLIAFLKACK